MIPHFIVPVQNPHKKSVLHQKRHHPDSPDTPDHPDYPETKVIKKKACPSQRQFPGQKQLKRPPPAGRGGLLEPGESGFP